MKKIMILYSTAGMGHKKAAFAISKAFEGKDLDVESIDTLDYSIPLYKFLYMDAYVFLMSKGKLLWGFLYWFSNLPFVDFLTRKLRGILDYKGLPELDKIIIENNPDAIIATHFLLPSIAGILREKNVRSKMYTLMTDYGPHSFWLSTHVDRFFVGSDSAKEKLSKRGISDSVFFIASGISVQPKRILSAPFSMKYEMASIMIK